MTGFEYLKNLNAGVRRPGDKRRIRYADEIRPIKVFRDDEDPVQAAVIEAMQSGRVVEIFTPAIVRRKKFGAYLRRIPVEYLGNLGVVTVRTFPDPPTEPDDCEPIDYEKLL